KPLARRCSIQPPQQPQPGSLWTETSGAVPAWIRVAASSTGSAAIAISTARRSRSFAISSTSRCHVVPPIPSLPASPEPGNMTIWRGRQRMAGVAGRMGVIAAALGLATVVAAAAWVFAGRDRPSRATLALGQELYAMHCASCHGADLEGQPDWKLPLPSGRLPAPPHDASGHSWHHPDSLLHRIVKE